MCIQHKHGIAQAPSDSQAQSTRDFMRFSGVSEFYLQLVIDDPNQNRIQPSRTLFSLMTPIKIEYSQVVEPLFFYLCESVTRSNLCSTP